MKKFTALIFLVLFSVFIVAEDDKKEDWLSSGGEEIIVKFESEPGEATVIVDGKVICQATPCTKILTLGEHEIEMRKENYTPKANKENITEGKTIKYKLEANCAWLSIKGDEAEIFLDGKYLGEPSIENKVIPIGEHKIDYSSPCYYEKSENFTVTNGEKKNIDLKLEPRESAIKVYAQDGRGSVVEADVYVDGKKLGKAPGTFKVPLCSKKVVVKKGEMEYSEILSLPLLESSLKEKQVKTIQASLLHWSAVSGSIDWDKAVEYCKNLEEGGYSDWRLPNIDELRTLVVNSPYAEPGGYCPISEKAGKLSRKNSTYNCDTNGHSSPNKLGDGNRSPITLWSSSTISDAPDAVFTLSFKDNEFGGSTKKTPDGIYVSARCVLNAEIDYGSSGQQTEEIKIAAEEKRRTDEEAQIAEKERINQEKAIEQEISRQEEENNKKVEEKNNPPRSESQDKIADKTYHPYKTAGISLIVVGAVVAAGGIAGFHIASDKEVDKYRKMKKLSTAQEAVSEGLSSSEYLSRANKYRDKAKTFQILEITSGAVGGALLVTGIALAAIKKEKPHNVSLSNILFTPSNEGFYASLGFEF